MTDAAGTGECRHWKDRPTPERAYRRRQSTSPTAEQDRAAGGRNRRLVDLGDGRYARASVTLRLYRRTRRIRAYLRWWDGTRSPEEYLGEVDRDTRAANLAEAWRLARAAGLLAEATLPADSKASSVDVRAAMRANRRKDTRPETRLRSLLFRAGLRYRVDAQPLSGVRRRADVVFFRDRIAVFVDGCFWHGCPDHYRPSTKNAQFWRTKIEGNRARDEETNARLADAGWTVIRVWEHEDPADAASRVIAAVRGPWRSMTIHDRAMTVHDSP
jgi:DNA mismatch endonuclease Vsr